MGNLQSTGEAEPELVWLQWRGGGAKSCVQRNGKGHVTHFFFFVSSRFSPRHRDQYLGFSQRALPKDGEMVKATNFVPGLKDSQSLWFGGGDRRDGIMTLSFTLQTPSAGTADLQQAWTEQERIQPLSPTLQEGPRTIGVG